MSNGNGWRQWVRGNIPMLLVGLLSLAVVIAIGVGIYEGGGKLLQGLKETEVARGLITFLVTLVTVAIALMYAIYAMIGGIDAQQKFDSNILKDRFTYGMPILTALIGVLGTILGFYYGQAKLDEKKGPPPTVPITAPDATAWLKKGVDFYKTQGKDKALEEFNKPKGQFVKDGLSIYVLDLEGRVLASPEAGSVGTNFLEKKDADGKLFGQAVVKDAKDKGSGSVEYKWENPTTKKTEPKTIFFQKVDDLIICAEGPKK